MALVLTLESAVLAAATAANSTLSRPANVADGNLLVAHIHVEDGVAVTPPSGWTLIDSQSHGVVSMQDYAYWKVASGEPTTWTWTHASTWRSGWVQRITGAPSTSPIDGTPTKTTGTGLVITFPSLTTGQNNSALVAIRGSFDTKTQGALTSPLVERIESTNIGLASGIQATAGASGAKTMDISAPGTDEYNGIMFAIKDAAESPSQDTPELRGRPFGLRGHRQMHQLLAQ